MNQLLQKRMVTCIRLIAIAAFTVGLCGAPISTVFAADGWFTTWAGPAQDPGVSGSTFPPDTSIREAVWGNFFGDSVRVKFSNLYGTTPRGGGRLHSTRAALLSIWISRTSIPGRLSTVFQVGALPPHVDALSVKVTAVAVAPLPHA